MTGVQTCALPIWLYRAAFALTEEMRGGKPLTDTALYDAVTQQQQIVLDAVQQLA